MVKEIQELTHARLEPALGGCPGLFTARDREGWKLDVSYKLGEVILQFKAADRLTPADLMTLAAIVAVAGPGRQEPGEEERALVDALACQPAEAAGGTLVVRTNRARVLEECGITEGGSGRKALLYSLIRLASLTAIASRGSQKISMHLLSFAIDEATGELVVALSSRLSAAILGGRHIRLELHELRALGEHARVLYTRLCVWIDPGRARRVGVDVLRGYLWPEPASSPAIRRKRLHLVRRAMEELGGLHGWRIEADERWRQYVVSRRSAGKTGTEAGISGTLAGKTGTPESAVSL